MIYPNRACENKLIKQGYRLIAGIDEVGRGAWAGPMVSAAVILNPKTKLRSKKYKIKDSKLITPKQRKYIYDWLHENALYIGVGIVSHGIIDRQGLTKANILSFKKAVDSLKIIPDHLLIDTFEFKYKKISSISIIKGDYKVLSIAAASIIAKVTRDEILIKYHKKFPKYRFDKHKGYGTKMHREMICKHGICKLHRKSYKPIQGFI